MIACASDTIAPFNAAIISTLRTRYLLDFDPDYEGHAATFHGGTPITPYFTCNGQERRIGWFVALLDHNCLLPGPLQPAQYYPEYDTRIEDRSLPSLIDHEIDHFFGAERLIPFAALYTNYESPKSLRLYCYDWFPSDSLCFDRSTNPQSIVYCNADLHVREYMRSQGHLSTEDGEGDGPESDPVYDNFVVPVASSFRQFCAMLYKSPKVPRSSLPDSP